MNCEICDANFTFSWTDTHGVGQCTTCGSPYQIYHYGADNQRVEKPAELLVKKEWIPVIKQYWDEHHRVMPSGFSFTNNSAFEMASEEDYDAFKTWMKDKSPEQTDDGLNITLYEDFTSERLPR